MKRLSAFTLISLGLFAGVAASAPNREPSVKPLVEEVKTIALDKLPKDGMISFGQWVIGQTSHENGVILLNRQTRLGIYLPWASNGWVNWRSGDGTGYVLWSRGGSDPQQRDYEVDRILGKQPLGKIAAGKHTFQQWTVTITEHAIEFHCTSMNCRMTVRRDAPNFVHNDRTIGPGAGK